ncbi:MAG: phosphoadenosine phosphosulfate reductase family protein [Bryobacterales bacterium]|nr:phosphoadenosine phosphosulfate reductase family protein [Bryobacterales bacterium]
MQNQFFPNAFQQGAYASQLPLFQIAELGDGALVASTDNVVELLRAGAAIAIGVSGGKDSSAVAIRTAEYLDSIGHRGPRILIHSDLGRIEWRQSLPVCERLAKYVGLDLVVVRRQKGDLLDWLWQRWRDNVRRYAELSCVKLILPWPTATMRFCTGELKTAVICRELVRRYPDTSIISVSGVRREESSSRAKAAIADVQAKLCSVRARTDGIDWRPILNWSKSEVLRYLCTRQFALHEAYTVYGSSRVSCAFCVLATPGDLKAAASCEANAEIYQELVRIESDSTFAFQTTRWLSDVVPHLLSPEERESARNAKLRASVREAAETRIPDSLLYTKGWPTRMPTVDEAKLLAEVRQTVASAVGLSIGFTDAEEILNRYAELLSAARAA